jgi:hypothetical protein
MCTHTHTRTQMALKCADLSHICSPLPIHLKWVAALEEEMFRQGDKEKAAGLQPSPLCDRAKIGISKSQVCLQTTLSGRSQAAVRDSSLQSINLLGSLLLTVKIRSVVAITLSHVVAHTIQGKCRLWLVACPALTGRLLQGRCTASVRELLCAVPSIETPAGGRKSKPRVLANPGLTLGNAEL